MAETATEAKIAQLESSYHYLGEQVGTLTRKFEEFASSVHHDLQALGNQRTPWGVLAAWATVILAIAGLAAVPFLQDLNRIDEALEMSFQRQLAQAERHGAETQRLNDARAALEDLDHVLQREMRLLDDNLEDRVRGAAVQLQTELGGLDTVLQREMRLLNEAQDEQLDGIILQIEQLADRVLRLEERIWFQNGKTTGARPNEPGALAIAIRP